MSENETILISLIRQHKNPEEAIITAIGVVLAMLNRQEPAENIPQLEEITIDLT